MKVIDLDRPITAKWIVHEAYRLDALPYLSGKVQALLALNRLKTEPLGKLTHGHDGGIYRRPQHRRIWVTDPSQGVPYLGSSDMLMADISRLPLLKRSYAESPKLSCLALKSGMTLISASGTIGRTVYCRPDMVGMWGSEDVMKINPNPERIPPGFLFAFLASRHGYPLVVSGTYGGVIQHIEPEHLADIPVPRLGSLETSVHTAIERAAELRARWQSEIQAATEHVFSSVGLNDISAVEWHAQHDKDIGYVVSGIQPFSFLALNYSLRARELATLVRRHPHKALGSVVRPGTLNSGWRFRRIEAAPSHGIMLIGQKDLFSSKPDGRWIAPWCLRSDARVEVGTTLIAAHGTLGEFEVYGQAAMVYGNWANHAYTQDVMRVVPNHSIIEPGFLFAYLRSHTAFRLLRCMSYGTKLQEFSPKLLREMPVPYPDAPIRRRIHERVMAAFDGRAEADRLEADAIAQVEKAIEDS